MHERAARGRSWTPGLDAARAAGWLEPTFCARIVAGMQALVAEVLAAWRRAERLSEQLPPGTPEHSAAVNASERLRDLYGDLTRSGIEIDAVTVDAVRQAVEEASGL